MPNWTARQWSIIGGVLAAVVLVGLLIAFAGGGGDDEAVSTTTTTTSTTTTSTTTTTIGPTYPLTGTAVTDGDSAARPALVVKIDNAEPRVGQGGRPQAGINAADVVYEEMVEGSVTRFVSVFHSRDADPVGPVRSARNTDVSLMAALNRPLFAWSGANAAVVGRVRGGDVVDVGYDAATGAYERVSHRPAPYNLFSSTTALRAAAPDGDRPPPALFDHRPEGESSAAGRPIDGVHIVFGDGPGSAPVDYAWDGSGWARSQRGDPHLAADGARVAPPNVVIRFTDYEEVQCCDASGFPILDAHLLGEGDAWVLTDGRLIEARWSRPELDRPTRYTTPDGGAVGLTPGPTWVAIAPPDSTTVR